jgi:hypothetical protein
MLLTFAEESLHVETETPRKNPSGNLSHQFYLLLVSLRFWYSTDMEVIPSKIHVNIVNEL